MSPGVCYPQGDLRICITQDRVKGVDPFGHTQPPALFICFSSLFPQSFPVLFPEDFILPGSELEAVRPPPGSLLWASAPTSASVRKVVARSFQLPLSLGYCPPLRGARWPGVFAVPHPYPRVTHSHDVEAQRAALVSRLYFPKSHLCQLILLSCRASLSPSQGLPEVHSLHKPHCQNACIRLCWTGAVSEWGSWVGSLIQP